MFPHSARTNFSIQGLKNISGNVEFKDIRFEMIDTYECTTRNERFDKRCSFNVNINYHGQQPIYLSLGIPVRMYVSTINPTKMNELRSHVGVVSPSLNGM